MRYKKKEIPEKIPDMTHNNHIIRYFNVKYYKKRLYLLRMAGLCDVIARNFPIIARNEAISTTATNEIAASEIPPRNDVSGAMTDISQ